VRAIGIPQLEDRRLRENVGAAQTRRVQRIAFDLRRAAHVGLDEHARRKPADRVRRRVKARLARDLAPRRVDVGQDLLLRLARAAGKAGECERRGHELEECAPVRVVLRTPRRELPCEVVAQRCVACELVETSPHRQYSSGACISGVMSSASPRACITGGMWSSR
jgi:hypothetical protein